MEIETIINGTKFRRWEERIKITDKASKLYCIRIEG